MYPGDPVPRLTEHATLHRDGFNLLRVSMGSQSGTHADAPYHFAEDGARIDDLDLSLFTGPAVVVEATDAGDRGRIEPRHLDGVREALRPGAVVLVRTGWAAHAGGPRYLDHPYLTPATAQQLVDAGVRTVGVDALSVDETPDPDHPGEGYPVHHLLASAGFVILENLTALERVAELQDPLICAFPVKLAGADGAPVRAVALEIAR